EVVARLQDEDLGPGATAVLASVWKDGSGGHAYLARNDGGTVKFFDPHTGVWSEELPWSEDQVSRTVVGYLKPDGTALDELHDPTTQLAHADEIGFVRGYPGSRNDGYQHEPQRAEEPQVRAAVRIYDGWQHELSERERRCVQSCYREGLSPEDAAARLAAEGLRLSAAEVEGHLGRARTALQPWVAVRTREDWAYQLPRLQRRCVRLCFIDGLSREQAVARLADEGVVMTVRAVTQQLARARTRLWDWINGAGITPDPVLVAVRTHAYPQDLLTPQERQVAELCYRDDLGQDEAAARLHLSVRTVNVHMTSVRTALEAWIAREGTRSTQDAVRVNLSWAVRADPGWEQTPGLGDRVKDCIRCYYGEGKSDQQTADELGIAVGTVKRYLATGRRLLAAWSPNADVAVVKEAVLARGVEVVDEWCDYFEPLIRELITGTIDREDIAEIVNAVRAEARASVLDAADGTMREWLTDTVFVFAVFRMRLVDVVGRDDRAVWIRHASRSDIEKALAAEHPDISAEHQDLLRGLLAGQPVAGTRSASTRRLQTAVLALADVLVVDGWPDPRRFIDAPGDWVRAIRTYL
ncbi:MAG: hypothetical protein J2P17_31165, partial [Mycobacterium sp.]|nr:hypothetical protein [Mycobacterium sp.]